MTDHTRPRRRIAGERRRSVAQVGQDVVPGTGDGRAASGDGQDVVPNTADDREPWHVSRVDTAVAVLTRETEDAGDAKARGRVGGRSVRVLVALAVVLAAAVAYDLILWAKLDQSQALTAQRQESASAALTEAPAQAERAVEQILAYRYDRLQADADGAKALMTDGYAQSYQDTVDDLLAKPASQVKARVKATVKDSGVARVGAGEVDVLLFVNQTSTTTLEPEPQTALNRVVLTMVERDGQWLVDEIAAL